MPAPNSLRFDTPVRQCLLGSQPNLHFHLARLPIQPADGVCFDVYRHRAEELLAIRQNQINFMATSICPFCGACIDTTPDAADTARWYRKHHPDLAVGSIIPEPCHDCGKPYEIGDKVRRRQNPDEQLYLVKALLERPNQPPLIEIVAEDGSSTFAIVAQLEHIERTGYIVTPDTVLRRDYF